MSPRLLPPFLLACAALAAGRPAFAAWSPDPAQPLVVCDASGPQDTPAIVPDGRGGAFVVWAGTATEHVLASGVDDPALPPNGAILRSLDGGRGVPAAIADGAGGMLVAWVDVRNFYTGADIYASHVLASGFADPTWTQNGVYVGGEPMSAVPALASDALGGTFIAWSDGRIGDGTTQVRVTRLLAAGALDPAWTAEGVLIARAPGSQSDVQIVPDGGRGAFVAWVDTRPAAPGVYAQHVLSSGGVDNTWPTAGARLSTAVPPGAALAMVADGKGGAFVAWPDPRDGNAHIYAHHVLQANGADTRWPAFGLRVSPADDPQGAPTGVSDGVGGLVLAWEDQRADIDLFAQHLRINGDVDPTWPASGVVLTAAAADQRVPHAVTDGAGGAVVQWSDFRDGTAWAPFAQHLRATGTVDATWAADGARLGIRPGYGPPDAVACANGSGGAIVTWSAWRGASNSDILAQRVDRFGKLGDPAPRITDVRDRPGDEGGTVHLRWDASELDVAGDSAVTAYEVSVSDGHGGSLGGITFRAAHGTAEYVADVPTLADSTGADAALETFVVRARNSVDSESWASAPATGYSVDNLAPATPTGLRGTYANQFTTLTWRRNPEPDVAGYRLYRGFRSSFTPDPMTFAVAPTDTTVHISDLGGTWYKLSAVDVHGNESGFTVLSPASIPGDPLRGSPVVVSAPRPNPASSSAELDYTLQRDGPVSLAVYDGRGRRVRRLALGTQASGDHTLQWDLRDDHGRAVGDGEYFLRFEAGGRAALSRITVVH